ncbi:MAG: PAS domain S-box protein [Anaeromyxobacter sp.]
MSTSDGQGRGPGGPGGPARPEPPPLTLASILDTIHDVFYRVDADDRLVVLSRSGAAEFGLPSTDALLGRPAAGFWSDPARREEMIAALRRDGAVRDWEAELRRPDGSTVWIATSARVLRDGEGRVAGYEGILRNITRRKEAEEQLRQSEDRFRQVFRTVPDTIVVTRARDGLLIDVNPGFERATGWAREDAIGRTTVELDLWADVEARQQMVADLRAHGEVLERPFTFRRRDGTLRAGVFSARTAELLGEASVVFVMRDVSEQRRLEAEHARMEAELRQAQKLEAFGQIAGGVAHDYNNLLTVQLSAVLLLKELPELGAEARELAGEIEASARRAASLTRQLLAFGRRQVLQPRLLELGEVVQGVLEMLRRVLREDVRIELRPASEPLRVHADAGMLEQVVMNLAVNARDAMPGGGVLTLALDVVPARGATPGRHVRLSVTDTGHGMDEATLPRVFEPFFTTKPSGKGTGLGLATVYGIVRQHGGRVEVESRPGEGATFRVLLPEASPAGETAAPAGADRAAASPAGRGERVLLVEDDPPVRQVLKIGLERMGYRVVACASGDEALERWRRREAPFDAVLTDMVMPGATSGAALAVALRAEAPGLPVVVMSGHSVDLATRGLPPGVAFVAKPAGPAELAAALRRALYRRG